MSGGVRERALVISSDAGLLLVTGCAHPGIVELARKAGEVCSREIYAVMGGFHLGGASSGEVSSIIASLKALEVQYAGPCHCTGKQALSAFREAFSNCFITLGAGKRISSRTSSFDSQGWFVGIDCLLGLSAILYRYGLNAGFSVEYLHGRLFV